VALLSLSSRFFHLCTFLPWTNVPFPARNRMFLLCLAVFIEWVDCFPRKYKDERFLVTWFALPLLCTPYTTFLGSLLNWCRPMNRLSPPFLPEFPLLSRPLFHAGSAPRPLSFFPPDNGPLLARRSVLTNNQVFSFCELTPILRSLPSFSSPDRLLWKSMPYRFFLLAPCSSAFSPLDSSCFQTL